MLTKTHSATILGLEAFPVEVEVDVGPGLPKYFLVGLAGNAVKESEHRTTAAITNSGFKYPAGRIVVNLAPADIRKDGTALDLPIALAILANQGYLDTARLDEFACMGELALDGSLRPVKGALVVAAHLKEHGPLKMILPKENAREAGIAGGDLQVYGVNTLQEALDVVEGKGNIEPVRVDSTEEFILSSVYSIDFQDVRGQEHVKRALEVAAAGGHNVLLIGPPGSGKSMMAKRLPGILPPLTFEEALEVTKVHSVAGLLPPGQAIVATRPFRSPHHTISDVGLVGGGSNPAPGEASLAHRGVLFLDELPEFKRPVLEALRQPLEDGTIMVSRARHTAVFPSRMTLVAAMNPTPSGYFADDPRNTSGPDQVQRYMARISGPLLDRIDLHIEVAAVPYAELSRGTPGESSASIRERVVQARAIQLERFRGRKIFCNAHMESRDVRTHCLPDEAGNKLLERAVTKLGYSARIYDRILKVARTIADLDGTGAITHAHLAEALQYRTLDRTIR